MHSVDRYPLRKGRPPLPEEVSRSHRVVTFVTAAEKVMLDELAQHDSSSLSAVCHQLIVTGLRGYVAALGVKQNQGDKNHET